MSDVPNPIMVRGGGVAGSGFVLKAFLPGTTTGTSIAISATGGSPQATLTANSEGKWEVSGNEVIPFIDRKHKWGIFANSTDAAANTPFYMGPFDNIPATNSELSDNTDATNGSALVGHILTALGNLSVFGWTVRDAINHIFDREVYATDPRIGGADVADGVANATVAIQKLLDSGASVVNLGGPENVFLCDTLTASAAQSIRSNGGTIKPRTAGTRLFIIDSDDVTFDGVVFDGDNLATFSSLIVVQATRTRWGFDRCTFKNVVGTGTGEQYFVKVNCDGTVGYFTRNTFDTISSQSAPSTVTGFCGAIFLFATTTGSKDIYIHDNSFEEMFTGNIAADINNSNADGIRILTDAGATVDYGLIITDNRFEGIMKSAIKSSGALGIIVDNNRVKATRTDVPMIAGMRFQNADSSVVSNTVISGFVNRLMNINSSNITVNNTVFIPVNLTTDNCSSGLFTFQATDSELLSNVVITNVTAPNCHRPASFSPTGITVDHAYFDFIFADWVVDTDAAAFANGFNIHKCDNLILDNIQLLDSNETRSNPALFISQSPNVEIIGGEYHALNDFTEFVAGTTSRIRIHGAEFIIPDSQIGNTIQDALILQYNDGSVISNCNIRDVIVSVPSVTTKSSQRIVRCNLVDSSISDLTMRIRDLAAANWDGALQGTFDNCKVDGVQLVVPVTKTGTLFAVEGLAASIQTSIYNVWSDERGVEYAGTKSVFSNIASYTFPVSDTSGGGTNTTGTTHDLT